jgi:ribokinase
VRADTLADARIVLAQLEIPIDTVIAAFRSARRCGGRTILNPAPAQRLPAELLDLCDIVVPNEHELALIGGPDTLFAHGVGAVITTMGSAGVSVAEVVDGVATEWVQPAFEITPTDTTGAGDAFCGALAARLATGDSLREAVRYAAAAGALATTAAGAVRSLPQRPDIEHLLDAAPMATDGHPERPVDRRR